MLIVYPEYTDDNEYWRIVPMSGKYVCKIASLAEVNEKWDTLIREHPDDSNWAVWKTDVIAEISDGKEIPYYGTIHPGRMIRVFVRRAPLTSQRSVRSSSIAARGIFRS